MGKPLIVANWDEGMFLLPQVLVFDKRAHNFIALQMERTTRSPSLRDGRTRCMCPMSCFKRHELPLQKSSRSSTPLTNTVAQTVSS